MSFAFYKVRGKSKACRSLRTLDFMKRENCNVLFKIFSSVGSPDADPQLVVVFIFFGTETYDDYERDVKVTME